MSKKQKIYTAEFKTKIVLELLAGDQTLAQIASKYSLISRSIQNWKKIFLANASLAFNADAAVAGIKNTVIEQEKKIDELHRQLGKRTAELEWASKKLRSLDFKTKGTLIKSELGDISILKKCALLDFNRSSYYYQESQPSQKKMSLLREIDSIYTEIPFFGYRKVYLQLIENGFKVGVNQVAKLMKELGLKVIYPSKKIKTTLANLAHKKYPYLLRDMDINKPNQVWSTDITYIRVNGGFVYLAAVIDWYSKAILSHKISNTMDESLVLEVLNNALEQYGKPEIFNTDQGSQYTSNKHTQLLLDNDIKISMDGKGRATDNIAIERFWRSAKYENIYIQEYKTIRELKNGVNEYIVFYNYKRFHQSLKYKKPMDVYNYKDDQIVKRAA
ncbi:TPA: IS3 family transposase [Legionella pneumophila subsp. pneumophila]|nr:IS3 family transposase [Legionella pneumophila subsp. pneumophila]